MNRTHVLRVALALTLAATLSGCFQHSYVVGAGAPDGQEVYRNWHHHWVFGLVEPKHQMDVALEQYCPSGNASIDQRTTFLNGLIHVLIGFVYSPTTVTILCEDGTMAEIELSGDEVAAIVTDPLLLELVAEYAPERLAEVESRSREVIVSLDLEGEPSPPEPVRTR